jgi:hypothetical protein
MWFRLSEFISEMRELGHGLIVNTGAGGILAIERLGEFSWAWHRILHRTFRICAAFREP